MSFQPHSETADSGSGTAYRRRSRFIGSWRLISFSVQASTGEVSYPFGSDARGTLIYTQDGRVCGALWRTGRRSFAVEDQQLGTPEEYAHAVQTYITYLGRFEVDETARTIAHHIEQSIVPNWNGTTQTRSFEFDDDDRRLRLTTPPFAFGGAPIVGVLDWRRERAERQT
jgi:hypothetical protein